MTSASVSVDYRALVAVGSLIGLKVFSSFGRDSLRGSIVFFVTVAARWLNVLLLTAASSESLKNLLRLFILALQVG